jgi:hypothetical protein
MGEEIETSQAEKLAAEKAVEIFMDGLALIMDNEDQWAAFMKYLAAHRAKMS